MVGPLERYRTPFWGGVCGPSPEPVGLALRPGSAREGRSLRVLMSAYACEPGKGSEPGVGWHFALAAAREHEVTVITRSNNRAAIESALTGCDHRQVPRFEYLDLPGALRFKRGNRGVRLYYARWQRALATMARQLHRESGYDVGHHVTLAADWMPVGLAALADELPFVWGPVGGSTGTPWSLARWLTPAGAARDAVRTVVGGAGRVVAGRSTARRAAVTLALNSDVARAFGRYGVDAPVMQHAVVADHAGPAAAGLEPGTGPVAVYAGRIEGWKGILLAVDAVARTHEWRLDVYGDGPDRAAVARRAKRLGVGHRVTIHGAVPLARVQEALATGDALLFPSMHDSSPFVVAEAMAAALPVVCLRRGGPADMVGDGEGVVVDHDVDDLPGALADALDRVYGRARPVYDGRWGPDRLPAALTRYYDLAVSSQ